MYQATLAFLCSKIYFACVIQSIMKPKADKKIAPGAAAEQIKKQRQERDAAAATEIGKDRRFAAVLHDPRFNAGPSRKQTTVEIDDRFKAMMENPDFQVLETRDKYGRKAKHVKGENLRRFYRLPKDEEHWKADKQKDGKSAQVTGTRAKDSGNGVAAAAALQPQKKSTASKTADQAGTAKKVDALLQDEDMLETSDEDEQHGDDSSLGSMSEGKDESDQDSEEEEEEESEEESEDEDEESSEDSADELLTEEEEDEDQVFQRAVAEWGVGAYAVNPSEPIPEGEQTHRLAVVDQDWEHTRAVDLLASLSSFVPKGSRILRVIVYPSDYGLSKMAEEAALGPQNILKQKPAAVQKQQPVDDSEDLSESDDDDEDDEGDEDDDKEVDVHRVRMYEQSKLRYYYAVVECDSVATAVTLYRECDGMEFEHSACKMDLRFIPDEQSFEGRQVRDAASSVPADYKPPEVFTTSLQHTDPSLTWDGEDQGRKKMLRRKFTEDEIKEADMSAYLASEEEEASDDDAGPAGMKDPKALREWYRSKLLGGGGAKTERGQDGKAASEDGSEGDEEGDEDGDELDGVAPGRAGGKSWAGGEDNEGDEEGQELAVKKGDMKKKKVGNGRKDLEMEVTYLPGLGKLGKQLKQKAQEGAVETVFEREQRELREKRAARKAGKKGEKQLKELVQRLKKDESDDDSDGGVAKNAQNDEDFFQAENGDAGFDDAFFNDPTAGEAWSSDEEGPGAGRGRSGEADKTAGKKAGSQPAGPQADDKSLADLELVMMDEQALRQGKLKAHAGNGHGSNAAGKAKLTKKEKWAARKAQKQAQHADMRDDDNEDAAGFDADLADPRFQSMFSSHEFALDPTDPRYKAVKGSKLAAELSKQQRQKQAVGTGPALKAAGAKPAANVAANGSSKEHDELRGMVAKLKRNGQQQQQQQATGSSKKARVL